MGARGQRPSAKSKYDEPPLMTNVNNLLKLAEENNCYEGDKLNLDMLVKVVARQNGEKINLMIVPMPSATSGSLEYDGNTWTVKVNSKHNEKRRQFTIAHELGHFMMHKHTSTAFEDKIFFRSDDFDNIEATANKFAANLLMPEEKVKRAISEGLVNLGALADRFGVSSQAMKKRVVEDFDYKLKQDD